MNERAEQQQPQPHWRLWQAVLGAIAVVLAVVLILNPEFAAFGFVLDAAFFDMLVLLISLQLQSVWSHLAMRLKSVTIAAHRAFLFTCYGIRT